MFVGALIGGLIESFVSRERMTSLLPQKSWLTVCIAAGAGTIFPVCECAVVPVVKRLLGKGLPLSAAVSYLLGGPIFNPIVAASTALAYSFYWKIVIIRMAFGYAIAVLIGLVMGHLFDKTNAIKEICLQQHNPIQHMCSCGCHVNNKHVTKHSDKNKPDCEYELHHPVVGVEAWLNKIAMAFQHASHDFLSVGHYLIIGAFVAAFAQTHLERSTFLYLSETPALSILLMMGLAILLNLCSEADAFISASFQGLIPLSAQAAFLLTGPMFDLKLLMMYQNIFQPKAIIYLALLILITVLGCSAGIELVDGISL